MTYCSFCGQDKNYSGLAAKPPGAKSGRAHICQECAEAGKAPVTYGKLIVRRRSIEIIVPFKGAVNG